MAPLSSGIADAVQRAARVELRGLAGNHTTAPILTPSQGNTLQCLALAFSTISVASSILAFYWFMKMRRSFRHDLIMLLIQSDMFKALWFMVYPIVVFMKGPVASDSVFCQVNGFFISLGIEASDFAVLMIAIHTALYIFRPRSSPGEGGLYPYRNIAYILWIIFPILMASLAFINERDAYVSEGTYCYLPVRPFWYRLALGWIPRYLIFVVILAIYASIYYYVRYKFDGFSRAEGFTANSDEGPAGFKDPSPGISDRSVVPPTPTLACHGLIPDSRHTSWNTETDERKQSESTTMSYKFQRRGSKGAHRFMLASFTAGDGSSPTPPSETSSTEADSFIGPTTPEPIAQLLTTPMSPQSGESLQSVSPSYSRATSWRDNFVRRFSPDTSGNPSKIHSVVDIFTVLRHHPESPDVQAPLPHLQLVNSRGQTYADAEILRTRDKIRRQLRFLFIYPLFYIGMWILPFVSHVLQYNDRFAINPPFGLTCITTVCICGQAAVDSWLFSTREKPWKQIPGSSGGFWESLKFWTGWKGAGKRRIVHGPGKTREEMVREARAAYRRRDEELAQRRNQADSGLQAESVRKGERSWWEVRGIDGTMSPVSEEVNPMEDATFADEAASSKGGGAKIPKRNGTAEDDTISNEGNSSDCDAGVNKGETMGSKSDGRKISIILPTRPS